MKLDAIFFATHPDDAELCCGGLIIKLSKNNKKTGIVDLSRGELSTRGSLQLRKKETEKASDILKISFRRNLGMKDGNIERNELNRKKIIKLIREVRPDIVFIPYPLDRHPDHVNASQLLRESVFYSGLVKIKTTLGGKHQDTYRPAKIYYYMHNYPFEPSFIVDISDEFELKMKSIMSYSSQFYNPDSNEPETFISSKLFLEFIEARAKYFGFMIGAKYGEPYYSESKLKLDIKELFN